MNTTADDAATNGNCTLREAIAAANGNAAVDACTAGQAAPTQDLIDFALGGGTPTIAISSALGALPAIAERVTIDGSTGGATRVELNGGGFGVGVDGLRVTTANVTLRKLVVNRFTGDGVEISGAAATGNRVEGCYIGTDGAGTADLGNGKDGILVAGGASQNVIGGDISAQRNVIAGNESHGVEITGTASTTNTLKVNYIGVDATGIARLWNEGHGVYIDDSSQNTIGCTSPFPCLVVGGRPFVPPYPDLSLVRVEGGNAISNTILGSYLGVGADGSTGVGSFGGASSSAAVKIGGASPGFARGTVIGCTSITPCNVISGNDPSQVGLYNVTDVTVQGNFVGLNGAGTASLMPGGFSPDGIVVDGCARCQIGGTAAGSRNVVSGNSSQIRLNAAADTTIEGNYIGPDATGMSPIASNYGIFIDTSVSITVGGSTAAARNIIAGLGGLAPGLGDGVTVTDCNGCRVAGNYIGTDRTGLVACANVRGISVSVDVLKHVTIAANVLSGNTHEAIQLDDSGYVTVTGNSMGVGADGVTAIPNGDGIVITNGMDHAQIGGTAPADRNVIAGNLGNGIIFDAWDVVDQNRVQGNYIGLLGDGATARGNLYDGIVFVSQDPFNPVAEQNTIGGDAPGAGNVISANGLNGIRFMGTGITNNIVAGNTIGLAADGLTALPNTRNGIELSGGAFCVDPPGCTIIYDTNAAGAQRIGTDGDGVNDANERNVISANMHNGIYALEVCNINGCSKAGNLSRIAGNFIGLAGDGATARGNGGDGIRWQADGAIIGSDANGANDDAEANRIANNGGDGVRIENGAVHNAVRRNQVFANGCALCATNLGIDLQTGIAGINDGVNPNDVDDVDTGTNDLMNSPVLAAAQLRAPGGITNTLIITFSADVRPAECSAPLPCRVEFYFAGDVFDPSGSGEGRSYLGADTIAGDVAARMVTLTLASAATACGGRYCRPGDLLSATMTNNLGSTGEFAGNVAATDLQPIAGDCNADYVVSAADVTAIVLEIFDGDGSAPAFVPLGSFHGHPVGCNPNGDAAVDAGDLSCLAQKLFGGPGASCSP